MPRRLPLLGLVVVALLWLLPAVAQAHDKVIIVGGADIRQGEQADDVVVIDGPVHVAGHVTGRLVAVSDDVTVSGRIDRDLVTVAGRATLLPGARVNGDLLYGDEAPRLASRSQVAGDVTDEGWRDVGNPATGFVGRLVFWLAFTVSSLVLGLVLLWFAPRAADAAMTAVRTATGPVVAWGFAVLIGLPVLAVIALATLAGIPFGVGLLLAMLPLLAVAYVTGAWVLGRRLLKPPRSRYVAFLAGWAILRVLALIPFLGGLTWAAATIVGLGALVVASWRARGGRAAEPEPAPAA